MPVQVPRNDDLPLELLDIKIEHIGLKTEPGELN